MRNRDERVAEEAAALWRELFGGPPPQTDGASLLNIITGALPEVSYDRMRSPHLRPSLITGPKSRGKRA